MAKIIQCILLIPTAIIIGGFWYMFSSLIINGTIPKKPTDKEIEEKTK